MAKDGPLTTNEAAAASRVPLKQVHRIIDAGLLAGVTGVTNGVRFIQREPGLLVLKIAYVTAEVFKPEVRKFACRYFVEQPNARMMEFDLFKLEVSHLRADLRSGLNELNAAKAMVESDPEVMGGSPCFRGRRIPVHDIADMLANGDTPEALADAYPTLNTAQIRLAPVFAAAYPRRGRPKKVAAWKKTAELVSAKRVRLPPT